MVGSKLPEQYHKILIQLFLSCYKDARSEQNGTVDVDKQKISEIILVGLFEYSVLSKSMLGYFL